MGRQVIRFGLSGITRIGDDLVKTIMAERPFSNIPDFLERIKITKPQMVNLIKAGAFDSFGDRIEVMHEYINMISDAKKRITLQNMKMLIDFGLIPEEYDLQRRVFNFNKYIKKFKNENFYLIDDIAFSFLEKYFDIDNLVPCTESQSGFKIKQTVWDSIYKKQMDIIRPFVKNHADFLLKEVNDRLTKEVWDKYCLGSISKWEMDSISCYIHEHELKGIDYKQYGLDHFDQLSKEPEIERYIPIKGKMIPIFKLHRIIGTVLDKDKAKKTVTLLTEEGVVVIKIYGVFQNYDKQISEKGADGHKHVLRKSEFSRGNKIIITGVRDGEHDFRAKKYSRTPYHLVETIESIDENNNITFYSRTEEK